MRTDNFDISSLPSIDNVFGSCLAREQLQERAPAVFATHAAERLSPTYAFLSTQKLLGALQDAGFVPVDASQSRTRVGNELYARHTVRLRRRFETVDLEDSVPELILLNSHDGSSAYQLRLGIYRVHCRNGLIVSSGSMPVFRVTHRGNILEELIRAALSMAEQFGSIAQDVERMQRCMLEVPQREGLAAQAIQLRYPKGEPSGLTPVQLLKPRRTEDVGEDLWRTFNVVQENVLRGGLSVDPLKGRRRSTRGITSIKQNVRLNCGLWNAATSLAA